MNEWYLKDLSRKLRSAQKAKSRQGYSIGAPPLGYRYDETDHKRWVIDPEGAAIVRRIYDMRINKISITEIAQKLKREKVPIPSVYAVQKGIRKTVGKAARGDYQWDKNSVHRILTNQVYVGDVINFRTYSKSYKLKKRYDNPPEKWEVHRDVHDPIIERSVWESIQKTFGATKCREPKHVEKNMFAGYLKCSDCGGNLNYKLTNPNPDNHYFSCHNKRQNNGLCKDTHHIRVDSLTEIVTQHLSDIVRFAALFEDEFVKLVVDEHYKQVQIQQRANQTSLNTALTREREVDVLYEKLFEEKALGNLTEERFQKLSYKYEDEQSELTQKIKHLKKIVEEEQRHEMNADGFLRLVRQYTDIKTLTPEILSRFIDRIVVHHRELVHGEKVQKVEIYYKMIGYVSLPSMSASQRRAYAESFGRCSADRVKARLCTQK